MIVLVGIILLVSAGYSYNVYSALAIQGLNDRYNAVIDVHVTISPALPSSLGQGKSTELWTVNPLSIDFGTVVAGEKSASKSVVVTYSMLDTIPSLANEMMYVTTDLSTPGVHLINGNSQILLNGVTYQYPTAVANNNSKILSFKISVDSNTNGVDINFHIVVSHDSNGGFATFSIT
jgi:hypothetical protein